MMQVSVSLGEKDEERLKRNNENILCYTERLKMLEPRLKCLKSDVRSEKGRQLYSLRNSYQLSHIFWDVKLRIGKLGNHKELSLFKYVQLKGLSKNMKRILCIKRRNV